MTGIAFILNTHAQQLHVFEEWATQRGVQEFFYKNVTVTDAYRNVYVAGATLNQNGDYDLMVTKYDRRGQELWTNFIAGPGGGHDFATGLVVDNQNNVIVSGSISEGGIEGNNMLVVKYDPDGFEYWQHSYDYNNSNEAAAALCIDSENSIYCTGASQNALGYSDMLTIKLDSASQLVWEETYDYNDLHDLGVKIGLSGSRVIVTGIGQFNTFTWQAMSLSYLQSNGNLTGTSNSGSASPGVEEVSDLFIDYEDNIYVAGSKVGGTTGYDMLLIKLDEDLNIEWTREWDGDGMTDKASGVRVAPNGDVYLSGTTQTSAQGTDVVLVKYNADGDLIWSQTYNGDYKGDDEATSLEWHDDGYLYIAGSSFVVSSLDYLTLKYDTTGALLWDITYNSPSNKDDRATNMAIDDEGDIIVSGQCEINDSTTTYYTVKYVERTVQVYDFADNSASSSKFFIQNNGQVLTDSNMATHQVKYSADYMGFPRFVRDTGWSITQSTNHSDSLLSDSILKVDFDFVTPIQDCKVRSFEKQSYFMNFYSPAIGKVERVPTFNKLVYQDVWANIGIQKVSARSGEMLIVAKPHAKLDDIKLDVSGANSLVVDSTGQVQVNTHMHPIIVPAPRAYQLNNGVLEELNWSPQWAISGSEIRLTSLGSFNIQQNLIIRIAPIFCLESDIPVAEELCYSSYFGGFGDDWVSSIISSDQEDRIIAGFSGSDWSYFPEVQLVDPFIELTGSGAYITRFKNDFEAEYTSILYGTPIPGTFSSEVSLYDTKTNGTSIFACGYYAGNILQPGPQVDAPLAALHSAFVAGFNVETGSMFWLTTLGGTGLDVASGLSLDSNGKITVVGTSGSTDGSFPHSFTSHSYNTLQSGQSGYIARFGADLELEWCNAFGGTNTDDIFCIDHFDDNSFVVAGHTSSEDLYLEQVSGSYQIENLPDNFNYFLARFSESGAYQWSTYIQGETVDLIYTKYDHNKGVAVNGDEFYFAASIRAINDFEFQEESGSFFIDEAAAPPGWTPLYANRYPFIKRFDSMNDLKWSTLLDEGGDVSEVNHVVAKHNLLVISGTLTTPESSILQEIPEHFFENLLPTFNIFNNTFTNSDGFITVFDTYQHHPIYGTFLGGFDTGSSAKTIDGILISSNLDILIAGSTRSSYTCNTDYPRLGIPVHQGYGDFYFYNNPGWGNLQNTNRSGFISHFCFEPGTPLHVDEYQTETQELVQVFPNPSSHGSINISLSNNQLLEHIAIYNLDGKCVLKRNTNESIATIDVSTSSSGLYIVQIVNGTGTFTSKFIVQ